MAIVNRDKDVSEQKIDYHFNLSTAVAASASVAYNVINVPFPSTLRAIQVAATSVSGAPSVSFDVKRFIVGAGSTTIATAVGATTAILAYGTSGAVSISMAAAGSTLLSLQTNDMIVMNSLFAGGNVAIGNADISFVIQALQDIKAIFGSST